MKNNQFIFKDYAKGLKEALDLVDQQQIENFNFHSYVISIFYFGMASQANAHHISGDL